MKEVILVLEKKKNNPLSKFLTILCRKENLYFRDFLADFQRKSFYNTLQKMKSLERLLLINLDGFLLFELSKEKIGKRKFVNNIQRLSQIEFIDQNDKFELWKITK